MSRWAVGPTTDWATHAACRDLDPDLFFPPGETKTSWPKIEEARAVCLTCPVQRRCLEYALRTRPAYGVWGGLSTTERRELLRSRSRAPAVV